MKLIRIFTLLVLCLSVCISCTDDTVSSNPDLFQKAIVLEGEIDQVTVTRVNDNGFAHGDVMGVYIVDYAGTNPGALLPEGNRATNVRFTFDEVNYRWTSPFDIYWKDDKTSIDVYGYYPHGSPSDVNQYSFTVQKDQSKAAANGNLGGYEASDFLWGKAENMSPTSSVIRLPMRHRMSNVQVTLVEGTGFAANEWTALEKSVLVLNTKQNSFIDLSTGVVSAAGEVATTGIIPSKTGGDFRAIVVPQTVAAATPLFSITVDGTPYSFKKEEAMEYVSGKMHKFSISVNKKENTGKYEFTLIGESITAWENDLVSHDATAREYIVIDVEEPGTLKECIVAANKDYTQLQNLKVTGKIDKRDFDFMKNEMSKLQSLNMKEVTIAAYPFTGRYGEKAGDANNIPNTAFDGKLSLLRIVLPDKLNEIEDYAFANCTNLTGSLIIPEGVVRVGIHAFRECTNMTGSLEFPTTLEEIGGAAFNFTSFTCEFKFPSKLKKIGSHAFSECPNFYGSLHLPDALESIGAYAFRDCIGLTGSIEIPQSITAIEAGTFFFYYSGNLTGTLTLHDGITSIGENAFTSSGLRGELTLPKDLVIIGNRTFDGCDFSGELKLPEGLATIGNNAFARNWRLMGTLEIPESVQSIGNGAFAQCRSLEGVTFSSGVETIQKNAFLECYGIGSIVCKGTIPPYVQNGAFDGVAKDNFTLEVPETSVVQYQTAPGWSDFKRVSAHRELVCRPALATAINTECTRRLVLNAEGEWEVESMPDWCELSETSGTKKTELTLTIKAMASGSSTRTGEIVFKLKDKEYTSRCAVSQYDYQYAEDEVITLQTATKGSGINLVFLGDGYNAEDISKGEYMKAMREQVEHFFGIEPYTTYRDYFNVYTAIAVSPETGIGTINTIRYAKFETTFTGGVGLRCDYDAVFAYALEIPAVTKSNLHHSLIIMTPNSTDYGGICQMWEDGSAIAFCPMSTYGYPFDTRGVLQHEAGGHGFGKLGDEYIYHNAFIDFCTCTCCGHVREFNYAKSLGWYDNLSLTGKMHEVPWAHFIFDDRYSANVDIFEGGYMHNRGVFRSEQNSCMNNDIPYYSAISRESIVKRIKAYAGETYSFEEFVANDKANSGVVTRGDSQTGSRNSGTYQHEPVIHKGKPNILTK